MTKARLSILLTALIVVAVAVIAVQWIDEVMKPQRIERAILQAKAQQRELRADSVRAIAECRADAIETPQLADVCQQTLKLTLEVNRSAFNSLQSRIGKLEDRRDALAAGR